MEMQSRLVTVTFISFGSSNIYVLGFLKAGSPLSTIIWPV